MDAAVLWSRCRDALQEELSASLFNMWIMPLQVAAGAGELRLLASNRFVVNWVRDHYVDRIKDLLVQEGMPIAWQVTVQVGVRVQAPVLTETRVQEPVKEKPAETPAVEREQEPLPTGLRSASLLNSLYNFDKFVEGKSNQLAFAAAQQVANNPGRAYNPFFVYGGVGLGKTHLMHAIGNQIINRNPNARVMYLRSERFVEDFVLALRTKTMEEFKRFYRSIDALLIDDIQFFAGKDQSQEEFFHTFNTLLEGNRQIVVTSDKFPKEINGLEDRLKSRFGWGLTVQVEPPELETRVAILMRKAEDMGVSLGDNEAFFIANAIRANVRDLEGALKRVVASAHFRNVPITMDVVKEALRDILVLQARKVSIDNIQRVVSDYYHIKLSQLLSQERTRSLARPRQIAMALSKELTTSALSEIAKAFNKNDHTTVLHACRQIEKLRQEDPSIDEDYNSLIRVLTS